MLVLNLVIIHSIWVRNLVPEGVSVKACSDRQRVLILWAIILKSWWASDEENWICLVSAAFQGQVHLVLAIYFGIVFS
jgi:hypothetical protein